LKSLAQRKHDEDLKAMREEAKSRLPCRDNWTSDIKFYLTGERHSSVRRGS